MLNLLKSLTTLSAQELKDVLIKNNLLPGKKVIDASENGAKKFMIASVLLMLVLSVCSFLGSKWMIGTEGPVISIVLNISAFGLLYLTYTNVIKGNAKYIILAVEFGIMSFNAFVTPGLFAQGNIGTQFDKIEKSIKSKSNDVLREVATFWESNNTVKAVAEEIAQAELRRDGKKGTVYGTAKTIANTTNKVTFSDSLSAPNSSSLSSLEDMNEKINAVVLHYEESLNGVILKAESAQKQHKANIRLINDLLNGSLKGDQRRANLRNLKSQTEELVNYDFSYNLSLDTIKEGDLQINPMYRAVAFFLEFILMVFLWLMIKDMLRRKELLPEARKEAERTIISSELDSLRIVHTDDFNISKELIYQLQEIKEDDNLKVLARGKKLNDLNDLLERSDDLEVVKDKTNPYTEKDIQMVRDANFTDIKSIVEKVTPKQFRDLQSMSPDHLEELMLLDKPTIKSFLSFASKMQKNFGKDAEGFEEFISEFLDNTDTSDNDAMKIATELLRNVANFELVDMSVIGEIDPSISDRIVNLFSEIKESKLREATRGWKRRYSSILIELEKKGLYTHQFENILKLSANAGSIALSTIFDSYEEAKRNAVEASGMVNTVEPILNTDKKFFTSLMTTKSDSKFLEGLSKVFIVPIIETEEEEEEQDSAE